MTHGVIRHIHDIITMHQAASGARPRKPCLLIPVALLSAVLAVTGCGLFKGCGGKPVIRLYDGRWESIRANNAIAKIIIEKGYGYPVEIVELTEPGLREAFVKGEINVNLEMWQQDMVDWYRELEREGTIINLGMTFESGPQFWIIPAWVSKKYDIRTVFDMKKHWRLFTNPENPSRGVFYNCIVGWECAEVNAVKMGAYGLDKYYDIVTPGSQAALEAAFERGQKRHAPVFGYYWAPTPLYSGYEWRVLEEPPYSDECWKKIFKAVRNKSLRPIDHACGYQDMPVDKVVHKNLAADAPDVTAMLKRMNVGLESLNRTLSYFKHSKSGDWDKAGQYYIRNYEERWKTWVSPDAYARVMKASRNIPDRGR